MFAERRAVLIFAQDANLKDGGEAARPLQYFLELRARGVDVHLLVHERNRKALEAGCPEHTCRVHFVPETWFDRACARVGDFLPERMYTVTTAAWSWIATQGRARRIIRRLMREAGIGLVHQPTPISPKAPSRMHGFGIPVVIGPLNGGMDFPQAFARRQSRIAAAVVGSSVGALWGAQCRSRRWRQQQRRAQRRSARWRRPLPRRWRAKPRAPRL